MATLPQADGRRCCIQHRLDAQVQRGIAAIATFRRANPHIGKPWLEAADGVLDLGTQTVACPRIVEGAGGKVGEAVAERRARQFT
jgi:hypothetical protein